jgi:dolichol kinase
LIPDFIPEMSIRMGICYTVMYLTGFLVLRKAVKVNYTRKINHFTLLLVPFLLSFGFGSDTSSNIEINFATEVIHLLTDKILIFGFLFFVVLIKPVRKRVAILRTAFSGMNRPEDEPYTLFWMASQTAANYAAAIPVTLYLGWIGRPELILIIILIHGIGDGLAEPIGIRFGKHKYETNGFFVKRKYVRTIEGSACVFISSIIAVMLFWYSFSPTQLVAALVAFPLVMTFAEAKAPHSWDNPFFFVVGGILLFLILQFVI